jgi:hypothetical protein
MILEYDDGKKSEIQFSFTVHCESEKICREWVYSGFNENILANKR